jgi:integrase
MARSARNSKLENRTNRLDLKRKKRHWQAVGKGLALGYRRTGEGYGTWCARLLQTDGRYALKAIGTADDYQNANGVDILDYFQAQEKARQFADTMKRQGGIIGKALTVSEAADSYMTWYKDHRRAYDETDHTIKAHILPALGDKNIADLTSANIRAWLEKLASRPARLRTRKLSKRQSYRHAPTTQDEKRARRASANRIYNVLKALLNRAFHDNLVTDDTAWRKVKPFGKVDDARIRFLNNAEGVRLVNACALDLKQLVNAALLTGARYGELVRMRANDVNVGDARVYISPSKGSKARYIPLNSEGVALFESLTIGSKPDDLVFTREDGLAWGKNHHVRALKEACGIAKIAPAISFHKLRHTYGSHLAQAGVDLLTISKLLGHADTRITSKHYAHLADRTLAAAVTKLPSFKVMQPLVQAVKSAKAA